MKKPTDKEEGITWLGEHKAATAHGYCVPDCPACLEGDERNKMILWIAGVILILGLLC